MSKFAQIILALLAGSLYGATDHLAAVRADLQKIEIDKSESWRVRDLELSEGDARIYLSEGVLAFATPVDGHRVAAVFSTEPVEAGDAELIALPPVPAERASLARFAHSPNLDEHFTSALLFFGDTAGNELSKQIHAHPLHPAADLAGSLGARFNQTLRSGASQIDVRITQSILDRHRPANSFFYGMLAGRTLGPFDLIFQPDQPDSLIIGRVANLPNQQSGFQMWAAYRPKSVAEPATVYHLTDYRIDTTINADLSMSSSADFDYLADADDGPVISLLLTPRLRVTAATIDGHPAAVLLHDSPREVDLRGTSTFLLVNDTDLAPGSHHRVIVQYAGSVIRRTPNGGYFVDDRNVWYPFLTPTLTGFNLTFHLPENLRLMATGDLVAEEVSNGQRMVHRRTAANQALAGFNLGDFNVTTSQQPPYQIDMCSNKQTTPSPDLAEQTSKILQYFTARWLPLPRHDLAVTPIDGFFGQGFPGLIYLSSVSYIREQDRPLGLRNASLDTFFSQLLLPHELAHQWWGNIVSASDYRANWIVEAMANYSALQYLEQADGKPALDAILAEYRADLTKPQADGELVDSYGPVTFDRRLFTNFGQTVWNHILYEKGTWIFHMLRERLGAPAFHDFQVRVLTDFSKRPISNEELRQEAARFAPANQLDRKLSAFFDTWVYDTGIPTLSLHAGSLRVTDVPRGYSVDVPVECGTTRNWVRVTEGETSAIGHNCALPSHTNFLFRD